MPRMYLTLLRPLVAFLLLLSTTTVGARKLDVYTDERIELLDIVQYLSGYPIINHNDSLGYKQDVEKYFGRFRNHKAVRLNKAIYRRMFGFDVPVTYMLHQDIPAFRQVAPFAPQDMEDYGFAANKDTLDMLRQAIKDFYVQTDFHRFFQSHQAFYDNLSRTVSKELSRYAVIDTMERHYGRQNPFYKVILGPLMHDGGYAVDVAAPGGHIFYAVTGPVTDSISKLPRFDPLLLLSELILHEFSHNFCNPLIDRHFKELEPFGCLLKPIAKSLKAQGYGTWKACLYEHFVRANEIVLNEKLFGRQKADELYEDYVNNGQWIYLKGLVPIIRNDYLWHRDQYPTEEAIMPRIVAYFKAEAAKCR